MPETRRRLKEQSIVLHQLFATNPNLKLSVGGDDGMVTLTRDEIISHVEEMDEFGQKYIKSQMDFMRSFSSGEVYSVLEKIESL